MGLSLQFRFLTFSLLLSIAVLNGCVEPAAEEVERVTSPDKTVDAVLVLKKVGATVSTPFEVYIVPRGGKPEGEPSMRADKVEEIKLIWKEPKFLEIHYLKGRIFLFTNFWLSSEVQNFTYIVELRLKPQNNGPSL